MRAKAVLSTNPGEGMAELSQQIGKLVATLTQTGQDSGPSNAPGGPQECWHGQKCSGRSTPSHPNSHNGRGGPDQMTPAHSLPKELGVEGTGSWGCDQSNHGPSVRGEVVARC